MTRDEATLARSQRADELEARLEAALTSLRELLRLVGGYMTAEQQEQVRYARALLAEEERR